MPTKRKSIKVLIKDEAEEAKIKEQAKKENLSVSNYFRKGQRLPLLKHGGKRIKEKE